MMLETCASEEAAKALILMDAIRCPKELIASRIGDLCTWWYSHLARLIYTEVVNCKASNIIQLRSAVDGLRKKYYYEHTESSPDDMSEPYILPNILLDNRERLLYTDVERAVEGDYVWSGKRSEGQNGAEVIVAKRGQVAVRS